jgi:hypothetical protein
VDIQLAQLRQATKEAMSLRGRKNLLAGSSISSSAEAAVIRGDAVRRVEPVSCDFELSLFDHNTDIENSRPETGPRNWPLQP